MQSNAKRCQTVGDLFWPGGAHTTNSPNNNYYSKTLAFELHGSTAYESVVWSQSQVLRSPRFGPELQSLI